ncbi:MAG: hypothetical protein AVDCRST_MAG87-2922, partial [uncultured Thermomicrobiales bacterium]
RPCARTRDRQGRGVDAGRCAVPRRLGRQVSWAIRHRAGRAGGAL